MNVGAADTAQACDVPDSTACMVACAPAKARPYGSASVAAAVIRKLTIGPMRTLFLSKSIRMLVVLGVAMMRETLGQYGTILCTSGAIVIFARLDARCCLVAMSNADAWCRNHFGTDRCFWGFCTSSCTPIPHCTAHWRWTSIYTKYLDLGCLPSPAQRLVQLDIPILNLFLSRGWVNN